MKILSYTVLCAVALLAVAGCRSGFLDVKPDKRQVVPVTVDDLQAMMDNASSFVTTHGLNMIGGENYLVSDSHWELLSYIYQKQAYIWADDIYENQTVNDWNTGYKKILYANTVLERAAMLGDGDRGSASYDNVVGMACFIRGTAYYQLAQTFCSPYDPMTVSADLGLPLRTLPDIDQHSARASLDAVYTLLIDDLKRAAALLPLQQVVPQRPNRAAAYGMLAKVYLTMQDEEQAFVYADEAISLGGALLDYNTVVPAVPYTFSGMLNGQGNTEILYASYGLLENILNATRAFVNPDLYDRYDAMDLRKDFFFAERKAGGHEFIGSYLGNSGIFTGLTLAEVLLIRAEAQVRRGEGEAALRDLNTLRRHRYQRVGYQDFVSVDEGEILREILSEREKECYYRGVRWEDIRRLGGSPDHAITVVRTVNNIRYELAPQSKRYVWPIPDDVIRLSGIQQNER